MISREKIEQAKEMLGTTAFELMADEIPLGDVDKEKLVCKSPFKQERTASAHWFKEGNCLKCFATGLTMDYIDFSMKYKNKSFLEAVEELFMVAGMKYDPSDFEFDEKDKDIFKDFKCSKDEVNTDRSIAEKYLKSRGISESTLDLCNVKQDSHGNIAYQFYNTTGKLIQTKYRVSSAHRNSDKGAKWFWQQNAGVCALLYGVNRINYDTPLVIVEGLNDRLACVEAGYINTVSIPGGAGDKNWIDFNFDVLEKCKEIILWFDDDKAGQDAIKECVQRLGVYRTKVVPKNDVVQAEVESYFRKVVKNIDLDENKDYKKVDANNVLVACGPSAVIDMIASAKLEDNPQVKRLMDVEEVQLQDMPRISSGFSAMDRVFSGSFENSLTILTGKSGNGKSSILNTMFVAAPLEAGEKVFIYSGEIPSGILLGNVIKPLASSRHIVEFDNSKEGRPNGYAVSKQAAKAIKEFYRDSVYVYNDNNEFDTNSKSILQAMEYSYKRYGVKNFIVDSLLTVDCSQEYGDDKYEKQKNFVINLKTFTNNFPVRVALVAHSRKLAAGVKEIGGDDIAGSSDILKCCNRAFSVEILWDDPDGYNTLIRCIKDRETGLIDKEVKLYFDKKSYRVYSDSKEHDYTYEWERRSTITYPEDVRSRLVSNIKHPDKTVEVLGEVEKK